MYSPAALNENHFHTFVALGSTADIHIGMTVSAAGALTSEVTVNGSSLKNLAVVPGDAMSAVACVNTGSAEGPKLLVTVVNETSGQTLNLNARATNLPAMTVDMGISQPLVQNNPTLHELSRFGVVYFDEFSAYSTDGQRTLTVANPITLRYGNSKAKRDRTTQ